MGIEMIDIKLKKHKSINIFGSITIMAIAICLEVWFFTELPKNSVGVLSLLILAIFIFVLNIMKAKFKLQLSKKNSILLICCICLITLGYIYNKTNIVLISIHLLIAWFIVYIYDFGWDKVDKCIVREICNAFYIMFLLSIIYCMSIYHSYDSGGNLYFIPMGDQNWTGVLIFLFFIFSWQFKRIIGVVICSYYIIFISDSRGLLLMVSMFFICKMFKKYTKYIISTRWFNKMYKIHFISTVSVAILSFYWIISVVVGGVNEYRDGLNDGSNKIRFIANIYAINDLYETPKLLLIGYDSELKKQWGIIDDVQDSTTAKVEGTRLVQPHNGVINLFVTLGVLPAVLYLYMFSSVLDKVKINNNIELILPYVVNAAFLHMYSIYWVLLWLFIIFFNTIVNDCSTSKEINF